ncbi:MAG: 50S ribosomal protein L6 [Planctomycetes bacterium]|nr:50S ribosomal protein L6 [Planctomycetota bacterium]MCC7399171.1 50S ribosomal protein L6 [Planctomycetota bacterium]
MSRIGKKPITVPKGVTVEVGNGVVAVKGPKGELKLPLAAVVQVAVEGATVRVDPVDQDRFSRAMHGTTRANIANMIEGVSKGYEKKLEINGVGYEAEVKGKKLVLKLGFNRPVTYDVPATVTVEAPTVTSLLVKGIDLQQVGMVASSIRKLRKPEPYKGKGIKYAGEVIKRKAGKAFASGGA